MPAPSGTLQHRLVNIKILFIKTYEHHALQVAGRFQKIGYRSGDDLCRALLGKP